MQFGFSNIFSVKKILNDKKLLQELWSKHESEEQKLDQLRNQKPRKDLLEEQFFSTLDDLSVMEFSENLSGDKKQLETLSASLLSRLKRYKLIDNPDFLLHLSKIPNYFKELRKLNKNESLWVKDLSKSNLSKSKSAVENLWLQSQKEAEIKCKGKNESDNLEIFENQIAIATKKIMQHKDKQSNENHYIKSAEALSFLFESLQKHNLIEEKQSIVLKNSIEYLKDAGQKYDLSPISFKNQSLLEEITKEYAGDSASLKESGKEYLANQISLFIDKTKSELAKHGNTKEKNDLVSMLTVCLIAENKDGKYNDLISATEFLQHSLNDYISQEFEQNLQSTDASARNSEFHSDQTFDQFKRKVKELGVELQDCKESGADDYKRDSNKRQGFIAR